MSNTRNIRLGWNTIERVREVNRKSPNLEPYLLVSDGGAAAASIELYPLQQGKYLPE